MAEVKGYDVVALAVKVVEVSPVTCAEAPPPAAAVVAWHGCGGEDDDEEVTKGPLEAIFLKETL